MKCFVSQVLLQRTATLQAAACRQLPSVGCYSNHDEQWQLSSPLEGLTFSLLILFLSLIFRYRKIWYQFQGPLFCYNQHDPHVTDALRTVFNAVWAMVCFLKGFGLIVFYSVSNLFFFFIFSVTVPTVCLNKWRWGCTRVTWSPSRPGLSPNVPKYAPSCLRTFFLRSPS